MVDECGQVYLKLTLMNGIDSTSETILAFPQENRPHAVRRVAGATRAGVLNWCAPGPISWRPIKSSRSFRMTRITELVVHVPLSSWPWDSAVTDVQKLSSNAHRQCPCGKLRRMNTFELVEYISFQGADIESFTFVQHGWLHCQRRIDG